MRSKRPFKNDVILQVRPVHIVSKSLLFYFFVRSDNWSDSAERSHCWQRQITHTSQSIDWSNAKEADNGKTSSVTTCPDCNLFPDWLRAFHR